MSGSKFLLDTNIVLYLLGGDEQLASFLTGVDVYVSVISEIELLAYPSLSETEFTAINNFLNAVEIVTLTDAIKLKAIDIRKSARLKLPDSIIAATSLAMGIPIITSDTSFQKVDGLNILDYRNE